MFNLIIVLGVLIFIEQITVTCFICNFRKENEYVKKLMGEEFNVKVKFIFEDDLKYFLNKSYLYKGLFYCFNIVVIYINALIPILNQATETRDRIYISIISAIASICTSIITFSNCHKNWTRHRNTFEILKYELENFIYQKESDETFKQFYFNYTKAKLKNFDEWMILRNQNKIEKDNVPH